MFTLDARLSSSGRGSPVTTTSGILCSKHGSPWQLEKTSINYFNWKEKSSFPGLLQNAACRTTNCNGTFFFAAVLCEMT